MTFINQGVRILDLMESSQVRFGTSGARGLVADMTDEVCFAYVSAFLRITPRNAGRVVLATDLRPSSPRIAAACAAAIEQAGYEVDYCGAIPTPTLAFHAQSQGSLAVMVTGSHIPFDRNGIKFYAATGEITKADEKAIGEAVVDISGGGLSCQLPAIDVTAGRSYTDRYLRFFPSRCLDGIRIGFYEHSSVARDLLREILESLGAQVVSLGRTDDFVPIDTEAVSEEDALRAKRWAEEVGFDAIISTDGDGDRPLLGDENGDWLRGDVAGILCARYLDAQAVATTVNCNTAIDSCGAFRRVIRTRIGSPYVIEGIETLLASGERNVVGFEPNGGFLIGSALEKEGRHLSPLMTRDAILPILCLLSMAKAQGIRVSQLSAQLPARFTASDRIQAFPTETSQAILQRLAASDDASEELLRGVCGKRIAIDQTDGLRMFMEGDEIVHLRPSGNAPELRCYAESSSQERSEQLVRSCLGRLRAFAAA